MKKLNIFVLGKPLIHQDGQPLPGLVARKSQALLCYLAYTGQPHSRQMLSGLLWSEMSEEKARRNLRVALTRMKDALEDFLVIQRRTLAFNKERPYWLDVAEFETKLKQKNLSIDGLKQATDLYRGPFLDDFDLRDAPLFEEWVRIQQEHYRQMAMDGLYRLSAMQTEARQFAEGITTLNRLLMLEPWMEEAHRQLMLLLAVSGQRSAALAQYETCASLLDEELGVEPASETTALYRKILAEEVDDLLPHLAVIPSTVPKPLPPPYLVPATVPHFVGRSQQQQAIVAALQAEKATAVQAIVGMGGVGKSTLAAQVASQLQGHFNDGILWANAATSEPMSVLESWAQLYGYDFSGVSDLDSMAAAFRSVLADKRVMLVLDDVTSAARIRPLLPSGPHCRVLLTTRDQDLARALNAQVWPLRELSPENGRLLLSSILGPNRVAAEAEAADEICALLQNLPLALEITAQRLKSRPRRQLAEMAQRLRDETQRLSLLKISDREVRVSFAVSWEALDAARQRVFALIGLFNGRSFTAEAMAHIASMERYPVEDRLFDLVNLSLLREEEGRRYRQHPLLADFAREQLGEDEGEGYGRFAAYYLYFAQQNRHAYDVLRPEWNNLMAAMAAAYAHQLWQTVIDFADALHDAWFTRGRFTQAQFAFKLAVESAQKIEDDHKIATLYLNWGLACLEQSNYARAKELFTHSMTQFKSIDSLAGLSDATYQLARIAIEESEYDKAQQYLQESKKIKQALDDKLGLAAILFRQGRLASRLKHYDEAKSSLTKALAIQTQLNDEVGMVRSLRMLTRIAILQKELKQAATYCLEALNFAEKQKDKNEQAYTLYTMSVIYYRQEKYAEAQHYNERCTALFQHIGNQKMQALALLSQSGIQEKLGQLNYSLDTCAQSEKLLRSLNDNYNLVYVLEHFCKVYISQKLYEQAIIYGEEAMKIAKTTNPAEQDYIQGLLQQIPK